MSYAAIYGDIFRLSEASIVRVLCLWCNKNKIFGMLPEHRDLGWTKKSNCILLDPHISLSDIQWHLMAEFSMKLSALFMW